MDSLTEEVDNYASIYDEKNLPGIDRFLSLCLQPTHMPTDHSIMEEPLSNPRQKIINIDCFRTRSPIFDSGMKLELEQLLTHYCRANEMSYKQGMNEIAAPFLLLRRGGASLGHCYGLFDKFFSHFCLNFYYDDSFNSIELFVKMFSVVLKYHDPALHRYLEWYSVEPQIFCIGWLMTLFSNKLSFEHVFELWCFMAADKDKYLLFFIVLALVLANRDNILEQKNVNILEIVTNLIFKDQKQLELVVERALLLRKATPSSLTLLFRDRAVFLKRSQSDYSDINRLLERVTNLNLFLVLPGEMVLEEHFAKGICQQECEFCELRRPISLPAECQPPSERVAHLIQTSNEIREMNYTPEFVIVDLRRNKTVPISDHWSVFPVSLEEPVGDVEQDFIEQFLQDKLRKHFVFVMTSFSFQNLDSTDDDEFEMCKELLTALNSMSFPLLSILEGGFSALEDRFSIEQKKVPASLYTHEKYAIGALPFNWKMTIGQRLELGNAVLDGGISFEEGLMDLAIFSNYYVIICEKDKELIQFLNYFQHNGSTIQYLYEHTHAPASIAIRKVIPMHCLKKAAMKIHHSTTLVLTYDSCLHFEKQIVVSPIQLFQTTLPDFMLLLQNCEDCQGSRRKAVILMAHDRQVNDSAALLAQKYSRLRKRIADFEKAQPASEKGKGPIEEKGKGLISEGKGSMISLSHESESGKQ